MRRNHEARRAALAALAARPPVSGFSTPLDYLLAEHLRHRTLCWLIDRIAESGESDEECIDAVLLFLRGDFGPHVVDEEEDLFPLLRRRAGHEDRIEEVLAGLSKEHAEDRLDATAIVEGLERQRCERSLPQTLRMLLRRFAGNERRHLIVENAIVLPLARARLTDDDLCNLGRRMAARRGVAFPENTHTHAV
ncbi:hemerythrin domain-containing protein [Stappia sp. F7233]|uniref:Hemerythrin domain-containing protein n=1 Tax=Stappia albiluteola TaxID=2758565 RepID=A0A839AIB1_9HYPH|nr:hemerythrin domain-containing protein [Stappia albiluteola]MBA5779471.1 hemerythrin domain-containing protein [Stappia albiluteola]